MKKAIIVLCLLLGGCTKVEKSYRAQLKAAQTDCFDRKGDEFKPLGTVSWIDAVVGKAPTNFSCIRFNKNKILNTKIAIYRIRFDGEVFKLEIE